MVETAKYLNLAASRTRESRTLDFKSSFDAADSGCWCEFIKDIIAFANSGGGVIIVGVNDDGTNSGFDVSTVLSIDPAVLTDKINSYTGYSFGDFEIHPVERSGVTVAAIVVGASTIPVLFTKPGEYERPRGTKKSAFAKGTVYFRHGAKSDPGSLTDMIEWREREIARIRKGWLGGIRQVVETPVDQQVSVVRSAGNNQLQGVRIVGDPTARAVRIEDPALHWPNRQADVIRQVKEALPDLVGFNGHDILCIKSQYGITPISRPDYVLKPHQKASPQYSDAFVRWIIDQYAADQTFFTSARRHFNEM